MKQIIAIVTTRSVSCFYFNILGENSFKIKNRYRISSNKGPVGYLILKFQGVALVGGQRLKDEGAYFKLKGIIHIKTQNFAIFPFQIVINN